MSSIGSGSVGARGSVRCETEVTGRVEFVPGELTDIAMDEALLLIDTAMVTEAGLYSLGPVEHSMLDDIACDSGSLGGASNPNSRRTDMGSNDLANDADAADVTRGEYVGCRDAESLTPLHQILPYGSQLRDTTSSAGHAWVNADIRKDE